MSKAPTAVRTLVTGLLIVGLSGAPGTATPAGKTGLTLYRDSWGVPHIYADREEDGFFALGYATGEDRLQQVLLLYLALRGELAEQFGPGPLDEKDGLSESLRSGVKDTVESDLRARRLRFLVDARANLAKLPPQLRADLDAYVSGLAAYMRAHPEKVPAWAPPLEPALALAAPTFLLWEAEGECDGRFKGALEPRPAAPVSAPPAPAPLPRGSNGWIVSGRRTTTAKPILLMDSHGAIIELGTAFYPWRMKAGGFDFLAHDLPGGPLLLFGHSPHYAWGWTQGRRYVADCYAVATEPGDPRRYRFDGQPRQMVSTPYRLRVKGGAPVEGTFDYTLHNGLLSPVLDRRGTTAYVMSTSYMGRQGFALAQHYAMAKARTRAELQRALEQVSIYPANMFLAGSDGTVLYARPGRVPKRKAGVDATRLLDGNSSATEWAGIHSFAELIQLENPAEGFVANNNISPDRMFAASPLRASDYPAYFAFEGLTNARQRRFLQIMAATPVVSPEGAHRIVFDEEVFGVRAWAPVVAASLAAQPPAEAAGLADFARFAGLLTRFDGRLSAASHGALPHIAFRAALAAQSPDRINLLTAAVEEGRPLSPQDSVRVAAAVVAGYRAMVEKYGSVDLAYGDIHRVGRGGTSLPVGGGSIVAGVREAAPGSGGSPRRFISASALRANWFTPAPGSRLQWMSGGQQGPILVVFGNGGVRSFSQTPFGVSDDPASRHYSDQALLASQARLKPTFFDRRDLLRNLRSTKRLEAPRGLAKGR